MTDRKHRALQYVLILALGLFVAAVTAYAANTLNGLKVVGSATM